MQMGKKRIPHESQKKGKREESWVKMYKALLVRIINSTVAISVAPTPSANKGYLASGHPTVEVHLQGSACRQKYRPSIRGYVGLRRKYLLQNSLHTQ